MVASEPRPAIQRDLTERYPMSHDGNPAFSVRKPGFESPVAVLRDAKAFKGFDAIFLVIRGTTPDLPGGDRLSFLVGCTLVLK